MSAVMKTSVLCEVVSLTEYPATKTRYWYAVAMSAVNWQLCVYALVVSMSSLHINHSLLS